MAPLDLGSREQRRCWKLGTRAFPWERWKEVEGTLKVKALSHRQTPWEGAEADIGDVHTFKLGLLESRQRTNYSIRQLDSISR